MVFMLALLTFVAFIAVVWFLSRTERRAVIADAPAEGALRAPPSLVMNPFAGSYLHPGHAWVRLAPDGLATTGASDFAANFVGALSGVEVPESGTYLRQGEPAWTLVSEKQRRLTQAMPLDGEIVEVNPRLLERGTDIAPSATNDWILKVRPARLAENLQNLLRGTMADAMQEAAGMRLNAALAPSIGRLANDGGVWMEHFGDLLGDSDWLALRRELFPPERSRAS